MYRSAHIGVPLSQVFRDGADQYLRNHEPELEEDQLLSEFRSLAARIDNRYMR